MTAVGQGGLITKIVPIGLRVHGGAAGEQSTSEDREINEVIGGDIRSIVREIMS